MLRQFHFIDQNGKDQGINVRNRSQELAKLLSDVDSIRAERKKARQNRNKYGGVEGGAGIGGGFSGGGSRYGGFGSEQAGFGGYQGEVYGDGGGFGGQDPAARFQGTQQRGDQFEEYDEGDDGGAPVARTPAASSTVKRQTQKAPQKQKEPEQDLFDFSEEPVSSPSNQKSPAAPTSGLDDFGTMQDSTAAGDDDFDDFQSATSPAATQASTNPLAGLSPPPTTATTTSTTQFAAPQPIAPTNNTTFHNILSAPSPAPSSSSLAASSVTSPTAQQTAKPLQPAGGYKPTGPNYYTSVRADANQTSSAAPAGLSNRPSVSAAQPSYSSSTSAASLGKPNSKPAASASGGGDAFGSLWSNASNKAGVQSKAPATKGPGLADMAKQKSTAGIWGAAATTIGAGGSSQRPGAIAPTPNSAAAPNKPVQKLGNGLDDLLG